LSESFDGIIGGLNGEQAKNAALGFQLRIRSADPSAARRGKSG